MNRIGSGSAFISARAGWDSKPPWFLEKGGAKDGMDVDPLVIPANAALGADYLTCMHLAGRYAHAGRDCLRRNRAVAGLEDSGRSPQPPQLRLARNPRRATTWVVRKGATPAFPGQKGFIGGSMGDISVIVEGVANDQAQWSLYSTVHGAAARWDGWKPRASSTAGRANA